MNEIVYDRSFEDYVKCDGINAGLLNVVDKFSLAHARAKLDGKTNDESDAKDFGRAFHAMLLENRQDFAIHPLVYPTDDKKNPEKPWNWNANYCKDWAKQQSSEILSHGESDDLMEMVASVRSNKELARIIGGARNEVSIFAEKNGIQFKARIDTLPVRGPIIDFKSTTNAKPEKFVRQAYDNGYFLQAAFYKDLLSLLGDHRDEFWFVPIEKDSPYAHSIIKFVDRPISFIEMGRNQYRAALTKIINARDTNQWPSYETVEPEVVATPWILKEMEQMTA